MEPVFDVSSYFIFVGTKPDHDLLSRRKYRNTHTQLMHNCFNTKFNCFPNDFSTFSHPICVYHMPYADIQLDMVRKRSYLDLLHFIILYLDVYILHLLIAFVKLYANGIAWHQMATKYGMCVYSI